MSSFLHRVCLAAGIALPAGVRRDLTALAATLHVSPPW